jgi:hypothetical protein
VTTPGLPLQTRFLLHVTKTESCWLWEPALATGGYGRFHDGSRTRYAHRVSYEMFVGPLLPQSVLRHTCDTPHCVNPAHLLSGTHADNIADKIAKRRHAFGEKTHGAKLDVERVEEIRMWYSRGRVTQRFLAGVYGVSYVTIHNIVRGQTWR